ncbi:DUF7269 family protein [Halocatena pleomorpha]|uniref:Uncharacterized protein n=1 Tax=Halocatena pleomorpha TaxID=1785090 RepID=A0A3P3RCP5_9EURY|nr:hypothetical protein [Halocatena pleomorpha]RRJ31277.1 hypothetical protein EIK79_07720 [Halocatena pleomorpha]
MNRVFLGVGALAVLAGLTAVFEPVVLTVVPSGSSGLVSVIGVLSLTEAARAGYSRYSRSADAPSLPKPERRLVSSRPKSTADVRPSVRGRRSHHAVVVEQKRIRDQLLETAVRVLVQCDGDTRERARERLQTGAWTDDPAAAAFFAPDEHRLPLSDRIESVVTGTDAFEQQANSAVTALSERLAANQSTDRRDDER